MKELRITKTIRVLFAFDPVRNIALLTGGDKTGNKRFYTQMIKRADSAYERHLKALEAAKGDQNGK